MKTRLIYIIGIAALLLTAGCARENTKPAENAKYSSFRPVISETLQTKAHLASGNAVAWDNGDAIGIYTGSGEPVSYYYNATDGLFHGDEIDASSVWAWYPQERISVDSSDPMVLHIDLGLWPPALPMIARNEGDALIFKQVSGLLHFSIKSTKQVQYLFLKSRNWEDFSGAATIDLREQIPVLRMENSLFNKNVYDACTISPEGEYVSGQPQEFWQVMPPMTFEKGFQLEIFYEESPGQMAQVSKWVAHPVTISRAGITSFTLLDLDAELQEQAQEVIEERNALIAMYNAMGGASWNHNSNWCSDLPVTQWYGVYTADGVHVARINLDNNNLSGSIPPEIGNFSCLEILVIGDSPNLTGSIPPEIGNLKSLKMLDLVRTGLNGSIPAEIGNLENLSNLNLSQNNFSGEIPPEIGKLSRLGRLDLSYNKLSGNLPVELMNLPISIFKKFPGSALNEDIYGGIDLRYNNLSGVVSSQFLDWPLWDYCWAQIVGGNNLDISEAMPSCPEFDVITTAGSHYSSDILRQNELTAIFQWWSSCLYTPDFSPLLKATYEAYKDKGFDVLSCSPTDDVATIDAFASSLGWTWPNFRFAQIDTPYNDYLGNYIGTGRYGFFMANESPFLAVYDKTGELVFSSTTQDRNDIRAFVDDWFAGAETYYSTDFSTDGVVTTLQNAAKGNGIDLVILGDGFSDRLIADGTFSTAVQTAVDGLFSVAPFSDFKELFNIYQVNVVSPAEGCKPGNTAFDIQFEDGTTVSGNDSKVFTYAKKAVSASRLDDALVIVILNSRTADGTCYMYDPASGLSGDYGRGTGLAYLSRGGYDEKLKELVIHEAGGHGFAKLADEYHYGYMGAIPEAEVNGYQAKVPYGWWKNIDFTGNPASVKWAPFINDARYASESIGCYEGGEGYPNGVWHSTPNSVMNYGATEFNAPSRYAIWYRIGKLAYGESWSGTYDEFVAYDLAQ